VDQRSGLLGISGLSATSGLAGAEQVIPMHDGHRQFVIREQAGGGDERGTRASSRWCSPAALEKTIAGTRDDLWALASIGLYWTWPQSSN